MTNNTKQKQIKRTYRKKKLKAYKVDWDNPTPCLQYNVWKGYGNPVPMPNPKDVGKKQNGKKKKLTEKQFDELKKKWDMKYKYAPIL